MSKRKQTGFTLIEVMITVVIVAILVAIAIPAYLNFSLKSRRSEAHAALIRVAGLQERFYLQNNRYSTVLADVGVGNPNTENGYYTLSIPVANVSAFSITATAINGSGQEADVGCTVLTLTNAGVKTPATCW